MSMHSHRFSQRTYMAGWLVSWLVAAFTITMAETAMAQPANLPVATSTTSKKVSGRHALLIGVSKYHKGEGYPNDLNTEADIEALKEILEKKFNFLPADITVLNQPLQTTAKSIRQAWEDLISSTQEGDLVFFHYSGHGSQVPDNDGDEIDQLDETLVPSDFDPTTSDTASRTQIRDDEVRGFVKRMLAKKPVLINMSFDCCNSGSNTRGRDLTRGFEWSGKPPQNLPGASTQKTENGRLCEAEDSNLIVICAARPEQRAQETLNDENKEMGLLTLCMAKALARADSKTTYLDLFDEITAEMGAKLKGETQHVQMEGKLDNLLMSGTALPRSNLITVKRTTDNQLALQAGELHGVTVNSIFELYPIGTKSFGPLSKSIGRFRVISTQFTDSILEPEKQQEKNSTSFAMAKALEVKHAYGDLQLNVLLDFPDASDFASKLQKAGNGFLKPMVAKDQHLKWQVKINQERTTDGKTFLKVIRDDVSGCELTKIEVTPSDENAELAISNLASFLRDELRWRHIKSLRNADPNSKVAVELRVVPVEVAQNQDGEVTEVLRDKTVVSGGQSLATLTDGDCFVLEVKVPEGASDVYVTVLNVGASGQIARLYPESQRRLVDENKFHADGKWHRIETIYTAQKPGGDILKAIATTVPTDFTPIISGERHVKIETESNPIADLFMAADRTERGSRSSWVEPGGWATGQVELAIEAKAVTKEQQ